MPHTLCFGRKRKLKNKKKLEEREKKNCINLIERKESMVVLSNRELTLTSFVHKFET